MRPAQTTPCWQDSDLALYLSFQARVLAVAQRIVKFTQPDYQRNGRSCSTIKHWLGSQKGHRGCGSSIIFAPDAAPAKTTSATSPSSKNAVGL